MHICLSAEGLHGKFKYFQMALACRILTHRHDEFVTRTDSDCHLIMVDKHKQPPNSIYRPNKMHKL